MKNKKANANKQLTIPALEREKNDDIVIKEKKIIDNVNEPLLYVSIFNDLDIDEKADLVD